MKYLRAALFTAFIIIAFVAGMWCGPGAETAAKHLGKSVRERVQDDELTSWADEQAKAARPGENREADIPRDKWMPAIADLLKDNKYARCYVCFDLTNKPNGVAIQSGIAVVVVPLNGSLPDLAYFSISMVTPTAPFYAASIYK